MQLRILLQTGFLLAMVLFCLAVAADPAGIGGPYGEYSMAYQGPETLTLLVLPDGSGDGFDNASLPTGGTEDATITLTLLDGSFDPIYQFPAEDIWLESRDGGMVPCIGGTIADANTDVNGITHWTNPVLAGGYSETLTEALVNGSGLELAVGVKLSFNSPDINGDLVVNLVDIQLFTQDFFSGYDFRSDFYRDGTLNLADISLMAQAVGAACP
jgi:hypothetical protein